MENRTVECGFFWYVTNPTYRLRWPFDQKQTGNGMSIELTPEQRHVIDSVTRGVKTRKSIQKIAGFAGTGKSTLVKTLQNNVPEFKVAAYTGKAVDVLKQKGVAATTIHSLIYEPRTDAYGNVEFSLKESLDCNGVIVDEASMVSKEIYKDLSSFNIPVIYVGDHGQLPPVSGSDFNVMEYPDYKLEEIHRNAGDIAHFANHIRQGLDPHAFPKSDRIVFLPSTKSEVLSEVDQVICAYNSTRVQLNAQIRAKLGHKSSSIVAAGEKVMCLRNNKKIGIFNGMQGVVRNHYFERGRLYIDFDSTIFYPRLEVDPTSFNCEKPSFGYDADSPHPFEYAYAVTAHKSQGSQWDTICVVEQKCKNWDHIRWFYTSVTRAVSKVYIVPHNTKRGNLDTSDPNLKEMFGL
jgi:exodeoxyribonuclease-5